MGGGPAWCYYPANVPLTALVVRTQTENRYATVQREPGTSLAKVWLALAGSASRRPALPSRPPLCQPGGGRGGQDRKRGTFL